LWDRDVTMLDDEQVIGLYDTQIFNCI